MTAALAVALASAAFGCRGDEPRSRQPVHPQPARNEPARPAQPQPSGVDAGAPSAANANPNAAVNPLPDAGPVRAGMPEAVPAGPAELAILAPLRPGAEVAGGTIEHISHVLNGRILVFVRRGGARGAYGVMLDGPGTENLLRAGRYVVYLHGTPAPGIFPMGPAIVDALNHHQDAPVPEGLSLFTTQAVPRQP